MFKFYKIKELEDKNNERNLWFTFNFNEIIYYTIEKVGEENV